ncbi:hypothetical protein FPV67DRAFT_1780992, partial [Lyophyllum atratum]
MADSSGSSKSVKEWIAAMPNTLTKLNTRMIFKTLDGDEAREFKDWFGTSKKKEAVKKTSAQPSVSAATSGANTPASRSNPQGILAQYLYRFTPWTSNCIEDLPNTCKCFATRQAREFLFLSPFSICLNSNCGCRRGF